MGLFRRHKPVRIIDVPPRSDAEAEARARQENARRQGMADARDRMRERSETRRTATIETDDDEDTIEIQSESEDSTDFVNRIRAKRGLVPIQRDESEIQRGRTGSESHDDDIRAMEERIAYLDRRTGRTPRRPPTETPRTPRMVERADRRGREVMVREDQIDEFDEREEELANREQEGVEGILYHANGELIADDRGALFQERRNEAMLSQDIKDRKQARKLKRKKVKAEIKRLDRKNDAEIDYMYPETMESVEAESQSKRNTEMLKQDIKDRRQERHLNKKMANAELRRIDREFDDDTDDEPVTRKSRKMEKWEVKIKKEEYKTKKQERIIKGKKANAELTDSPMEFSRPVERPQPQNRDVTINITPNGVRTQTGTRSTKTTPKAPPSPAKTPSKGTKKPSDRTSGTTVKTPKAGKRTPAKPTATGKKKPATVKKKTDSTATKKRTVSTKKSPTKDTKKKKKGGSNGGGLDWFEEGGSGLFD